MIKSKEKERQLPASLLSISQAVVTISAISPGQIDKYKKDLVELERKCFPTGLAVEWKTKKWLMTMEGSIIVLANYRGKVIGESYGHMLEECQKYLGGQEKLAFSKLLDYYLDSGRKAFYTVAFSVLPEHQGEGIGTILKSEHLSEIRRHGYDTVVGHANSGKAIEINQKFGARIIFTYPNWYGTGETHYLYELDMNKLKD